MHSRFGWIGMCLLLAILSLVARASQTYRITRVEKAASSDDANNPRYGLFVNGQTLYYTKSELEPLLGYVNSKRSEKMKIKVIEGLKDYSFEREEFDSPALAFDGLLIEARRKRAVAAESKAAGKSDSFGRPTRLPAKRFVPVKK